MKNAFVLLASASALVFSGCVSTPPTVTSGPLLETRVDLRHSGRVAVVAFSSAAEVNVLMPSNKTEAVRDATDGIRLLNRAELKSVARASGGEPIIAAGLLSVPMLFPAIAAVAGSIDTLQSWVRAEPEHKLAPTREALQTAVAGIRLETLVRDRLLTELRGETKQPLVLIDDATLREIDPRLSERAWRNDAGLSAKARQALATRGLQRVLEIKVHAPALVAPSPLSRDLALTAQVRVRLVTVPEGIELYRRESNFFGTPRPYPEWAAHGAALVRTELARCLDAATEKTTPGLVHHRSPSSVHGQLAVVTR